MKIDFNVSLEITFGKFIRVPTKVSWTRLRKQIKRRDGALCQYCGMSAPDGQCDHVVPLSKGGTDQPENLVWACTQCNLRKGAKSASKYLAELDLRQEREVAEHASEEQCEQIIRLHNEGKSRAFIEESVFGYTGGTAYYQVREVLASIEEIGKL